MSAAVPQPGLRLNRLLAPLRTLVRPRGLTRFVVVRLLDALLVCVVLSILVFGALHVIPGDPGRILAGPEASQATVDQIDRQLGLDRSLVRQYVDYVGNVLHGDFGRSVTTGQPISHELGQRYPTTVTLAALALGVALGGGIVLGVLSAFWKGRGPDLGASTLAVFGVSVPVFWLGLVLIYFFGVKLKWLPTQGLDSWRGYVLPVACLATYPLALVTRLTRASTIEVLDQDYVRTARAKGLAERRVLFVHALRNALVPTVTAAGLSLGFLLGGAVVVEDVFNINGLGSWTVQAVLAKDVPAVQAGTLVIGIGFVLVNLAVDLLYTVLDPRIRY